MKTYKVIGLMSGSSLDGVDLAYCHFIVNGEEIDFELKIAETIPFPSNWITRLKHLPTQNALTFVKTHTYFGHYLGELINDFIKKHELEVDCIASHGHTIFHAPDKRFTTQIGDGAAMAAITQKTVVCDFRTQDIAIDGEGTPIAPAADRYLFSDFDFCMNIGGIANITCNATDKVVAFDIASANQVMNTMANILDLEYDDNGELAHRGEVNEEIIAQLNEFDYFKNPYPKSIANGWIQSQIIPIYLNTDCPINDKLRTAVEHLATQTAFSIQQIIKKEAFHKDKYQLLITGGGAFNGFLMDCIQEKLEAMNVEVLVPSPEIIEYKEAILMGLMGVLRIEKRVNCFQSVTGAKRDTVGGAVYFG